MHIPSSALASLVLATMSVVRPMPSHATSPRDGHEIVTVNGVTLTADRFDAAVNALIPMESFHRSVPPAKMTELRGKALQQLVDEELEYQEGRRLGVGVATAEVDRALAGVRRRYPSTRAFDAAIARAGMSLDDVRREIRRSLIVKKVEARAVASNCRVGPDEAARYYADNPDRFTKPEELHVHAITIGVDPSSTSAQWAAAKARAEEISRRLQAGAPFDEVSRTMAAESGSRTTGDMGFVHRGSLTDEFEAALRDLPIGQPSEPVQTLYGFHIIRVTEVRSASRRPFGEVKADLVKNLTANRCEARKTAWLADLRGKATIVFADDSRPVASTRSTTREP